MIWWDWLSLDPASSNIIQASNITINPYHIGHLRHLTVIPQSLFLLLLLLLFLLLLPLLLLALLLPPPISCYSFLTYKFPVFSSVLPGVSNWVLWFMGVAIFYQQLSRFITRLAATLQTIDVRTKYAISKTTMPNQNVHPFPGNSARLKHGVALRVEW